MRRRKVPSNQKSKNDCFSLDQEPAYGTSPPPRRSGPQAVFPLLLFTIDDPPAHNVTHSIYTYALFYMYFCVDLILSRSCVSTNSAFFYLFFSLSPRASYLRGPRFRANTSRALGSCIGAGSCSSRLRAFSRWCFSRRAIVLASTTFWRFLRK